MNPLRTADKANRRRPETPLAQAVTRRLHDFSVVREPQIIIGAHVDHIGAALKGDVIFLVRGNHALSLPQPCCFDVGDFSGVAIFSSEVTHISLSNPESLCPIVRSA